MSDISIVLNHIAKRFLRVYFVPGNHEYYGIDVVFDRDKYYIELDRNIYILDSKLVTHNNIGILGTTLWTNISYTNTSKISDLSEIRYKNYIINTTGYNELHKDCRAFLLINIKAANIVITHHIPAYFLVEQKHKTQKNAMLNEFFYSNIINDIIYDIRIDRDIFWVYGHGHSIGSNVLNTSSGHNITFLTNCMGYDINPYFTLRYFEIKET
jgi:hypothetical protein